MVGRRCSALLVLGLGEVRGFGWGFFGGALGAARSTRILEEMVGTGAWLGLALASFSECSECSDDKKVWGVGVGIFVGGLVFFCKFAEMYGFF